MATSAKALSRGEQGSEFAAQLGRLGFFGVIGQVLKYLLLLILALTLCCPLSGCFPRLKVPPGVQCPADLVSQSSPVGELLQLVDGVAF